MLVNDLVFTRTLKYSPLHVTASFSPLVTLPSKNPQNHPSEGPVPFSSFPRSPKNKERSQSTPNRNPPPKLDPKSRIAPTSSPNPARDLVDPPEIRVHDIPPGPAHGPSGDLQN